MSDDLKPCPFCGGEIQKFQNGSWQDTVNCGLYSNSQAYRSKPQPKRLVTWVQWDNTWGSVAAETLGEAKGVQRDDGGYIYRLERDPDGSNPTIELVKTGGKGDNP